MANVSDVVLRRRLKAWAGWTLAACGAVAASVTLAPWPLGLFGGALAVTMISIAAIDSRHFIIPDGLVLTAIGLGLTQAAFLATQEILPAVLVAAARGVILGLAFWGLLKGYERLRGRPGIGLGDVKLAVAAGVWLDWPMIAVSIEIAALAALAVVAVCYLRGKRISRTTPIPFGTFLAPAMWLGWLLQAAVPEMMFGIAG
jgi:leader peptidase (prepilin peptidase)/N-methyltransferase